MSKFIMFLGAIVSAGVLIYQTILTGIIPYDVFLIFATSTLGANSINKALSVAENIKTHENKQFD